MSEIVWSIVVAGGTGSRFGGLKQFVPLSGRRVIDHATAAAATVSEGVVAVVPSVDGIEIEGATVVRGGATRSESVRAGLAAVPAEATIVAVHDAARPLATADLFARVVGAVRDGADAAVPVVSPVDTLRYRSGGHLDRDLVAAVQTPQVFRCSVLRGVHATAPEATDDASLVEAAGGRVVLVEGERANLKVTEPVDLLVAAAITGDRTMNLRVGNGFDIHRFADDGDDTPLILGGVHFGGEQGLAGHSDGDVIAHVCAEALLGAAALGDLGQLFPDTDPVHAGADSMGILADVVGRLHSAGWAVVNIDCSVICEKPRLAPHREAMQSALTAVVGAPVTVKGRRAEGIGGLGRGEGIAATATALIRWGDPS